MTQLRATLGSCVLAGLIATGALALLRATEPSDAFTQLPFALPAPVASCSEDREHAEHAARAALHVGRARMRRYPFAPRDGRDALTRFAEAADCARLAGDAGLSREAADQLAEARARIERDVRDHAQRYALLREHGRLAEAADAISYLSALGWPERGAFAERLRIDRAVLDDSALEDSAQEARR
jgi:hypothetical protein